MHMNHKYSLMCYHKMKHHCNQHPHRSAIPDHQLWSCSWASFNSLSISATTSLTFNSRDQYVLIFNIEVCTCIQNKLFYVWFLQQLLSSSIVCETDHVCGWNLRPSYILFWIIPSLPMSYWVIYLLDILDTEQFPHIQAIPV